MTDAAGLTAALADRYLIERELGRGGMATVYLAHDIRHDRKVAVKVLRPELSAILGAERFLKEIRLTANLQHPHILPLHDSGTADGTVFYVMPYVEGESLRHRLDREKQLPVDDAVRIAREVASALDYAHRRNVVHRDIKPENILLHDGQALVADFGIALAVSTAGGSTRITETGMSLGTPHYMSPEQAMGEREITARSDVYALGCVLYEMLVGEPPFNGPTAQAIIARVVTEEPRPLRLQRKTIPPHVEAAVQTALSKLPPDRFASAAQFAEALTKTDYTAPGTQATRRAVAAPRFRHATPKALPWALLLAASTLGVWGWVRATPQPVSRYRILLGQVPTPGTLSNRLAIAPDGTALVFVDSVGGTQQLWIKDRSGIDAAAITGTTGATSPTFSPDGSWIAFVADGKLKKVPRLGGSPITIADSVRPFGSLAIAWLENGTILFNNRNLDLLAVHESGGAPRHVVTRDSIGRGIVSVTGLPGARSALVGVCTTGCEEMDLRALDLRSGELRTLIADVMKAWYLPRGSVVFVRRDGGVFSAPFDLGKHAFRSAPTPVFGGVRTGFWGADIAVSPSGSMLYVAGAAQAPGGVVEAVWVSREGEITPIDPGWAYVPSSNFGLALSPDGRRLALSINVSGNQDIWVKELDSGPFTRLTFGNANAQPRWTRDGSSLIYVSRRLGQNAGLRERRADGTGSEATLADLSRSIVDVELTPDPEQLIVRLAPSPTRDIMLMRRGDSAAAPLLASDTYEEVMPALSPDGRWLAYASDESGRYEVYIRPFPDVNAGRWQISRNGGNEPVWAHSGRELFYRDGNRRLVAVTVNPAASFSTGEQRVLFSTDGFQGGPTRQYVVAPDDRRFVFTRIVGTQATEAQTPLVLVENWFTELRQTRRNR